MIFYHILLLKNYKILNSYRKSKRKLGSFFFLGGGGGGGGIFASLVEFPPLIYLCSLVTI